MSHPFANVRQSKVERSRVPSLTKGYASGGTVTAAVSPKVAGKVSGVAAAGYADGGAVKPRLDRPQRAKGGRVGKTTVNVIVAPQGDQAKPPMPPVAGLGPAGPVPPPMVKPPMAPPPGPMAGPGGPPPGMPMPPRSQGGRTYASGGAVKSGPAFEEGKREGTQVSHDPGKNDLKDVGRKRVITYATGGAVEAPAGRGPKLPGGGRGGLARLAKAKRAAKNYAKPA